MNKLRRVGSFYRNFYSSHHFALCVVLILFIVFFAKLHAEGQDAAHFLVLFCFSILLLLFLPHEAKKMQIIAEANEQYRQQRNLAIQENAKKQAEEIQSGIVWSNMRTKEKAFEYIAKLREANPATFDEAVKKLQNKP